MINKENVKLFNENIVHLLNNTIPGIVLLEVFFKQGFFSKTPENIFAFLLYLVWAYLLSVPFNLFDSFNFTKLVVKVVKDEAKSESEEVRKKIDEEFEKYIEENDKEDSKMNTIIQFLFILIYLLLVYISYKFLTEYFVISSFWKINILFLKLFICYIIVFLISMPLRFIVNKLFYNFLKKKLSIST